MGLVENIKSLCNEHGTSIPKLGAELGFGNGAIYNWNKMSPSIDKVKNVADYFKVSLDRVLYGFELTEFVKLVNFVKDDRTIEQFSRDTGVELDELYKICSGFEFNRPSRETVEKIASSIQEDWLVNWLVSKDDLLEKAGYVSEREGEVLTKETIHGLSEQYEDAGFYVRHENEDHYEKVYIDHEEYGTVASMFLHEFLERGQDTLNNLIKKYAEYDSQLIVSQFERGDTPKKKSKRF
ncbi:helix-turn-helix transcriptional regulator [Paenibacillus larvae]|nr:helix-turn-helix transcriptional regulator [Paenibacillus larvae]MDT2275115.1 helix-turn-helix transcriptional regulator [Paenibacillus larvae]